MPPDLRLTKQGVTQQIFFLVFAKPAKGSYRGLSFGGRYAMLPTLCPDCKGLTMEVVEHEPDDSYEARCTDCGAAVLISG